MNNEIIKEHPSYGMLQIARTNGRCNDLFGTSIQHNSTIRLSIHNAQHDRHLNNDWYYSIPTPIIEIEMSAIQWAEAITNLNTSGTPCTLRYINGEKIESKKIDNKRKEIDEEFEYSIKKVNKNVTNLINKAEELLKIKNPKVSEKQELLSTLNKIKQDLNSNMPFIKEQFTEQMDKTVSEAKCEVETFIAQKIHSLGMESLEQLKLEKKGDK